MGALATMSVLAVLTATSDVRAVTFVEGRLVVGTWGAGLFAWDGGAFRPLEDQPDWLQRVSALAVRGDGALVAARPEGLGVRTVAGWERGLGSALPDNDLSCLARTSEGLWVGTFRAGLTLIRPDGTAETWTPARGLVDDRVNRLAVDGEGDLWVATERGVMERQGGRFRLRGLLGQHVFVVAYAAGRVYASSGPDLAVWTGSAFEVVEGFPGRRLQDLAEGPDGAVLAATAEGLAVGTPEGRTLHDSRTLPDDWATAAAPFAGGLAVGTYALGLALVGPRGASAPGPGLWVNAGALAATGGILAAGVLDGGLWLHDATATRTLGTAEGLPDADVTDVVDDGAGGLWVATRGGLAHVGPAPHAEE